jgi:hypothetical protein
MSDDFIRGGSGESASLEYAPRPDFSIQAEGVGRREEGGGKKGVDVKKE